ncbi:hypothetical protein FT643_03220 [Ketobacter sp. MCCC 1A13808]|uniref:GumC family protein n=1 Tax=Ketobacter sp. MCCC 1A13808 TaxID=2602738 RepID=UPI0012EB8B83|nr:hypothetical protein [Ketobacter sp. MCCC 1A13808]MVF11147.1 hypothetical protein [Ketobacter sp. MCCC 1A13808]
MNEASSLKDIGNLWDAIKRRKIAFIVTFAITLVVGVAIVLSMPYIYRSESTVLIERQISADLVSTTITGNIQERIQVLQQKAYSQQNLIKLARKVGMLKSQPEPAPKADPESVDSTLAEELSNSDLTVEDIESSGLGDLTTTSPDVVEAELTEDELEVLDTIFENLYVDLMDVSVTESKSGRSSNVVVSFVVAYESTDPKLAATMSSELTQLLLLENKSARSEKTVQVTTFLNQVQARLKDEIQGVENEIAQLREQDFEFLPEQLDDARKEVGSKREELININGEISFLESREGQLKARLKGTRKHVISDNTDSAAMQDPVVRLQQAKLDLQIALQSYTKNHPDVIQQQKLIQDLENEIEAGTYAGQSDLVVATNPEYISISEELNQVISQLESTKARKAQFQSTIDELGKKFSANPAVELRYNQLMRDLERAQKEYSNIKSRLYEAQLAQSMEQEQKGERFTLLAGANLPREPVRPNRIALFMLSFIFAAVVAGGRVFMSEAMDNTVRSARDMLAITGAKPIGIIPVID